MALVICPDCAKEVSPAAVACPNCGHPFAKPTTTPRVIVQDLPPEKDGFPTWAFIPLGILGVVLLFGLIFWMRNSDDDQRNVNVRVTQPAGSNTRDTVVRADDPPNQIVVPSAPQSGEIVVPQTADTPSQSTTVTTAPALPAETAPPDRGTVSLEAKIATRTGTTQPVRSERFYLLDRDVESILNEARIEDETGQGVLNAFGLSVVYPDRYGETNKRALNAIQKHIVYRAQTDSNGKAQIKDVKPDSYYLFAITKSGNGFAVWSSPVSVRAGQNELVLPPVRPTEITR
jgi:hypothetical protein